MNGGMTIQPWSVDDPVDSSFALPTGLRGRLAGRFMLWMQDPSEVLAVLDVQRGHHVLEIGYGPGGMLRRLAATEAASIVGVDPSPDMQRDARALTPDPRLDVRLGTAADTGLPSEGFDRVVSIHNVALWPSLEAGIAELRRVTRPSGRLVIAWHGGLAPSIFVRSLRLPEDKLERIATALGRSFASVTRVEQQRDTVFVAE